MVVMMVVVVMVLVVVSSSSLPGLTFCFSPGSSGLSTSFALAAAEGMMAARSGPAPEAGRGVLARETAADACIVLSVLSSEASLLGRELPGRELDPPLSSK